MSNYKTITDTGPYVFSPHILRTQQTWLHQPTASPGNSTQPPGNASPPGADEQSPPSFFEQGNRIRWLLLLLPFAFSKYFYHEISPFSLTVTQFQRFYFVFFLCSVLITHLALNAKRRTLRNLLHDTDETPYNINKIKTSYNRWTNTSTIPLLCITIAPTRFLLLPHHDPHTGQYLFCLTATAIIYCAIYTANNFEHSYKAIHHIQPPYHASNITPEGRNMLVYLGTLAITWMWLYDELIAAGVMDPEDD